MVMYIQEVMNTTERYPDYVTFLVMAPQFPNTDTHSASLRRRRSSYGMGTGSKKFRPSARRNKMRMVRALQDWKYGQDL